MCSLTEEEFRAFHGLNESYDEMELDQNKVAPKCHFKTMFLNSGDNSGSSDNWWECSFCGHTQEVM